MEYRSSTAIDWSVSQRRTTWISTTHPSRPPTAHRCAAGSTSTSREAPILQGPGALEDEDEIIAARRVWQGKLAEGGLAGVTWPKEYGGQGLGPIEQVICNQEIARAKVPGILDAIGVGMLGPTIIAHGSEEQKSRYLGPMLHGDEVWCQLFSEPAAGSDLAAVQTRARQQDDGSWRLTGQKVWTTNAQFASYGLLLARTDADVPKHKGLTMFVVPMDAEGVTVRGLRQISGEAEFNEVFFDDVALDEGAVVGGVGNGWGTGADHADVRARHDRPRQRGHGLQLHPLRRRDRRATSTPAATPRCATSSARSQANCSPSGSPATARSPRCRKARSPAPRPASRRSRSSPARSRPAT